MGNDFRIIAIEPLKGCKKELRKVLALDKIYVIQNSYLVTRTSVRLKEGQQVPDRFYSLPNERSINVSAIVGKNGSGKSSIVELMYAAIYNAAFVSGILTTNEDEVTEPRIAKGVRVSVYFQSEGNFYCLRCHEENIQLLKQKGEEGKFVKYLDGHHLKSTGLVQLFYTIAINYSHYSLTSYSTDSWLKHLFHKNDGYQTPIVINPYRDEGIIGMRNEEHLTLSRITSNLLTSRKSGQQAYNELAPGKKASHILFKINKQKLNYDNLPLWISGGLESNMQEIIESVNAFFPFRRVFRKFTNLGLEKAAYLYICKKLFQISQRYTPYKAQRFQFLVQAQGATNEEKEEFVFSPKKLGLLLEKMAKHPSHITFKFRQAINFLRNIDYYYSIQGKPIPIEDLSEKLNDFIEISKKHGEFPTKATTESDLITVIPPSFFSIDIRFENKGKLKSLSSGEKQKIFSSASWIYHLINLDSVREDDEARYVRYKNINIVFDEVELYYHPELQRTFIKDFLDNLSRVPLSPRLNISCIFITHSPFILSDIPSQNILFLDEKGLPDKNATGTKTFGANIHDLLKHSFFLVNGSIGEFAKEKINDTINFLNHRRLVNEISLLRKGSPLNKELIAIKKREEIELKKTVGEIDPGRHKMVIEMIGEPIIQIKLAEMFDEVMNENLELSIIRQRIKDLQYSEKKLLTP